MMEPALFKEFERPVSPEERKESKEAERKRKAKLAYKITSEKWKAATWEFAIDEFLPIQKDPFIFEQLTTAYEKYAAFLGKPLTVEKRAFAGLRLRLLREKKIAKIDGAGFRSQGNMSPLYRSLIGRSSE